MTFQNLIIHYLHSINGNWIVGNGFRFFCFSITSRAFNPLTLTSFWLRLDVFALKLLRAEICELASCGPFRIVDSLDDSFPWSSPLSEIGVKNFLFERNKFNNFSVQCKSTDIHTVF